jgi:phosphate uptake regulator
MPGAAVPGSASRDEDLARDVDDATVSRCGARSRISASSHRQPATGGARSARSSVASIASDLERMADHANGIAVLVTAWPISRC